MKHLLSDRSPITALQNTKHPRPCHLFGKVCSERLSTAFCITARPSPLPRRHKPTSGCSCKAYNQEPTPCCKERPPLIHRLWRQVRNRRRRGCRVVYKKACSMFYSAQSGVVNSCKYLTLYPRHEPQTLLKVRADAMQTCAKLVVAVVLARAACVVANVKIVAALCHCRDPQVKLSKEREICIAPPVCRSC